MLTTRSAPLYSYKKNRGIAVLLMTSILLVATLTISLSSYNTIFFQFKRAHNEIAVRQSHWLAQGVLDCVFSHINQRDGWSEDELHQLTDMAYFHDVCDLLSNEEQRAEPTNFIDFSVEKLTGRSYQISVHSQYKKANSRVKRKLQFNTMLTSDLLTQYQSTQSIANQTEVVLLYPKWVEGSWHAE